MLAVYFLRQSMHFLYTVQIQYAQYKSIQPQIFDLSATVYKIIKVASHAVKNIFKRMLCSKELTQFKCGAVI